MTHMYRHSRTYIRLREFVPTHVILAPGTSEGKLGAAALAPLDGIAMNMGDPGMSSTRLLFVR